MKKKLLLSAVASVLTAAGSAHAVHVNTDGLGQVLLYPYFTVQNGFNTAIHVVNTTTFAKAVKVRFLEGKNSQEVLDFNLYLSPQDVWTGVIVREETVTDNFAGNAADVVGAKVLSADTSCVAPTQLPAAGQPFRDLLFDTEGTSTDRTERRREGYVEIIEMGVLTDPAQITAVTHVAGRPANCSTITAADFAQTVALGAPTGGLFGTGHLVSVNGGVRSTYDAVALDNFFVTPTFTRSGEETPSLADVQTAATIVDGARTVSFDNLAFRVDNVSAVLTERTIYNEYEIDAGRESQTDWIVTFPTKRFYVNTLNPAPFQNVWNRTTQTSCHTVSYTYYDREEAGQTPATGDFSPAPVVPGINLCAEVNTVRMAATSLFGAVATLQPSPSPIYSEGWMALTFGVDAVANTFGVLSDGVTTIQGLPVVGFAASRNVNKVGVQVEGQTVFSAYMGGAEHKGMRSIR